MSKITFQIGAKGGISVYGIQRFPVTLYREQWLEILTPEFRAFVEAQGDACEKQKADYAEAAQYADSMGMEKGMVRDKFIANLLSDGQPKAKAKPATILRPANPELQAKFAAKRDAALAAAQAAVLT